ncbi:MAG: MFS transporter, partial [Chitinivibrionales bacterium]
LLLFLVAFWLYHDGVHAFVMMATDFGLSIGIPDSGLMTALLLVQFIAFPAAILFGYVADRIGAKNTILIAIGIYTLVCLVGAFILQTQLQFFILAGLTGSAQGAIQALSRSMFTAMIPEEKSSDYFGFYNLVGRFSVVLGPGLVGMMGLLGRQLGFESVAAARFGIASLAILFISGGLLLLRVRPCAEPAGEVC